MRKRIVLFVLVVALLSLTFSDSNAESPIRLYINGLSVNSNPSPMIVNDRVMVPLRVISENLGTEVQWDSQARSVSVGNKKSSGKMPIIEGTDEFKEVINGVLDLAKQKDEKLYNWYISNADIIKLGYVGDAAASNFMDNYTKEAVITFDENYFNIAKSKYSRHDLILLHVGVLAHECEHTPNYFNYIYNKSDVESLCWLAAVRAYNKVGGNNSEFEKFFKDCVYDQLKL